MGRANLSVKKLIYKERGVPEKVLELQTQELNVDSMAENQVLVRWLASPINPADINQIEGVYPVKPDLPATGGNEGCGVVEKIASNVKGLKEGDKVVPAKSGLGTWCTHGIYNSDLLFPVDAQLERDVVATFQSNPPAAYRMLRDYVELKKGDTVMQNAATSSVGRFAIQICRNWGLKSVNVIREEPNTKELKEELKSLGADEVYTEEEFSQAYRQVKNCKLALNCVGGQSSLQLARALAPGGCMVTYGGLSKQPVQVPTSAQIFKDVSAKGFWLHTWYRDGNQEERTKMYTTLAEWSKNGKLKTPPVQERKMEEYREAIAAANDWSKGNVKQLLVFQ